MTDIHFTVTRGKLKGQELVVHQICNDWVTATTLTGEHANGGQPINLQSCYFDVFDVAKVLILETEKQLGSMFTRFFSLSYFMITGKFKRLEP